MAMADLLTVSVMRNDLEYQLSISWNDTAFADGSIEFGISAKVRSDGGIWRDLAEATIAVRQIDGRAMLVIELPGFAQEFPLEDLHDELAVLDAIPGWVFGNGDPITGCLIRAGISASVGQIIACKNATLDHEWYWDKTRAIGRCLRQNIPAMGAKMAYRAARCVVSTVV